VNTKLDRTYYDRSDALNGVAHHMNKMLEHRRHAADIARQFNLDIALPNEKSMLEAISRAAILKHTPGAPPIVPDDPQDLISKD
jgi:hypothetical protein